MKKLFVLLLTFTTFTAYSATTGLINLYGLIPVVLAIVVSPLPVAGNLVLNTTQTNLKVAAVAEVSNSTTGYKIKVASTNSGTLKHTNTINTITYTARYDTTSFTLSNIPVVVKNVGTGGIYVDSSDLDISYTGLPDSDRLAGAYSDVLTISIEAN